MFMLTIHLILTEFDFVYNFNCHKCSRNVSTYFVSARNSTKASPKIPGAAI
jgi:hypothetical protein